MVHAYYEWANVESPGASKPKVDLRVFPTSKEDLVCTCSAHTQTNNYLQNDCKYYKPAPFQRHSVDICCTYDRFGIMCDKVTHKDGRSIN